MGTGGGGIRNTGGLPTMLLGTTTLAAIETALACPSLEALKLCVEEDFKAATASGVAVSLHPLSVVLRLCVILV